jgi:hypothetical protein
MDATKQSAGLLTSFITPKSVDREGNPIRLGDVVADLTGSYTGGTVIAIAGSAIVWRDAAGGFDFQGADDLKVIAKADASEGNTAKDKNGDTIQVGDAIYDVDGTRSGGVVVSIDGDTVAWRLHSGGLQSNPAADVELIAKAYHLRQQVEEADFITDGSVDRDGNPIRVGDRIEQLNAEETCGIVVGVFGDVLVHCLDFEGSGFDLGEFLYANCNECRVLSPVTNVAEAVKSIRAKAAKRETVEV